VLQALFNERLAFTPFNEGSTRGYQFFGTGSYRVLLVGDTCPTSIGGPNGIRTLVGQDLTFAIRGVATSHERTPTQRDSNPGISLESPSGWLATECAGGR